MAHSRYEHYDTDALAVLEAMRHSAVGEGRDECQASDLITAIFAGAGGTTAYGGRNGSASKLRLSKDVREILDRAENGHNSFVRGLDLVRATLQVSRRELIRYLAGNERTPAPSHEEGLPVHSLEEALRQSVIGQEEAVLAVAENLQLRGMRLDSPSGQPEAVFLFSGPTGVGKTKLAAAVARNFDGGHHRLLRLDCSEYSEAHQVARLIGAPPSYVGYGDPGLMEDFLKGGASGVVLLDEFEKAHPAFHRLFLQAFDAGRLTSSTGKVFDLSQLVFIATTNVFVRGNSHQIGFAEPREDGSGTLPSLDELKRYFPIELLNRFDEIITFKPLSRQALRRILREQLVKQTNIRLMEQRGIAIELSDRAERLVLEHGYSEELGARHLRRTFARLVLRPIAHFLAEASEPMTTIFVDFVDGKVSIQPLELSAEQIA